MYKEVTTEYNKRCFADYRTFHFNLKSNGRLQQPMTFEINYSGTENGHLLYKKSDDYLISLGCIFITKQNWKDQSYCWQNEERFYFYGIEKAICGKVKEYRNDEYFTPKRILILQMK